MERLYQTIEEAIITQKWKPIRASRDRPLLSNLFFANDVILFAEADVEQETVMNDVLHRFFQASGQKLSFAKSSVFFQKHTTHATN